MKTKVKTRCLLYIVLLSFILIFLVSGCGGEGAADNAESQGSKMFTGYVFAPSSQPMDTTSKNYNVEKMVILTESKPPAGYRPVAGAFIVSAFDPETILAVTNSSGMFQVDLEYVGALGGGSSNLAGNLIVLPPTENDGELAGVRSQASAMKKESEPIKKLILVPNTRVIFVGESVQLKAMTVTEGEGSSFINPTEATWQVSDGKIASITPSGVVRGLRAGDTQVTVSINGLSCTGKVKVMNKNDWFMLNGEVLDENNNAVRGAVVTIEEVQEVAVTNAAGRFLLKKVPANIDLTLTVEVQGIVRYKATVNYPRVMNFITIRLPGEQPLTGNVQGRVTSNGTPLQGVKVSSGTFSDVTDVNGQYRIIGMSPNTYTFTFEKDGYQKAESPQTIIAGETVVLNMELIPIPQVTTGTLDGHIVDHAGNPIAGAAVIYSPDNQFPGEGSTTSNENGYFRFEEVNPGNYRLQADKQGYNTGYTDAVVQADKTTSVQVVLHSLASIQVTPVNPFVADGYSIQFKATGIYTDNTSRDLTTDVNWTSSNPEVAVISNETTDKGLAQTLKPGTTGITAELQGKSSSPVTLTVTAAELLSIQVNPANASVAKGYSQQFTATGLYSDNSTKDVTNDVTWYSSNAGVAIISNQPDSKGLAVSVGTGMADITASCIGVVSLPAQLRVTDAELVSVQVEPSNPSIAKGFDIQFTAIGLFSDNSTQNLTEAADWISSDITVANVSNVQGSKGLASTWMTGQTDVRASVAGITSPASRLTVTEAVLVSIQVEPVNPSVAKGYNCQFTATGTYSDSTTRELTQQVTWFSSSCGVAAISNADGSKGLAVTLNTGTTGITAVLDGVTSPASVLTVTPAELLTIQVEPVNPSVAKGYNCQFTATGTYSDSTTRELTQQVAWLSSVPEVATISNADGSRGLAYSVDTGVTDITAVLGGVTSCPVALTVTPAELVSIAVTPVNPSIPLGYTLQFTATGTYSDQSTQNLTGDVTWFSSNTNTAVISNAAETKGLATSVSTGTTGIQAVLGSVYSPTTSLSITPAVLVSIQVTPEEASIAKGFSQQFRASGIYSDGGSSEITESVTWTSSSTNVAVISNLAGNKGLAASTGVGTTYITASLNGITSPAGTLHVTPAELVSLVITPKEQTIGFRRKDPPIQSTGNIHRPDFNGYYGIGNLVIFQYRSCLNIQCQWLKRSCHLRVKRCRDHHRSICRHYN
jgi:hypothetical protein